MSPPADSHVTMYNKLPPISRAYDILRDQLGAGPEVSLDDLMSPILRDSDVRTLLRYGIEGEDEAMLFGIWIVHIHFDLNAGERMVSRDNITRPLSSDLAHVADHWDGSFRKIEFLQTGEGGAAGVTKAPSAQLATEFQELLRKRFGVTGLGLCIAPTDLKPGYIYVETTNVIDRLQIIKAYPADSLPTPPPGFTSFPSSWSITSASDMSPQFRCNHSCAEKC